MFNLRKAIIGTKFVWLMLFLILQFCPYMVASSSCDLTFASSDSGEVIVDGISYYVLLGDFHMHTSYSDGRGTPIQMVETAREDGYDFIAITDHGAIQGALNAREEVERKEIRIIVIIGEEVTTNWGHLLALDINQVIPQNLEPNETCEKIHDQGGYAVPAHPLYDWNETVFKSLIESHQVDAYEAYNGNYNCTQAALSATSVVAQYPFVGDSDAHSPGGLGFAKTIVFSVNRTVNGIFDAVLNHRAVVKWGVEYVGNTTLVNIVEGSSKMFEAKAAIGSAEISILRAKGATYLIKPDLDRAEELFEDSLNYYGAKDYDNAIAAAQQVKDTLGKAAAIQNAIIIAVIAVTITVIAVFVYRKRRSRRAPMK